MVPADTVLTFSSYHPPSDSDSQSQVRSSNSKRSPSRIITRPREQFVQSNYRFVVDPDAQAALHPCKLFADAMVPWNIVDLVFVPHESDCPICLHPLRCPRVTPCGHVFDYVCMLQLFAHATADDRPPRCPLCAQYLSEPLLKPCAFSKNRMPVVGALTKLRLVSRPRSSMLCQPHTVPHPTDYVPIIRSADVPFYSRIAYAARSFLLGLVEQAVADLHGILREDPVLSPFVSVALSDLKNRKKILWARSDVAQISRADGDSKKVVLNPPLLSSPKLQGLETNFMHNVSDSYTQASTPVTDKSTISFTPPLSSNAIDKSRWYFYQDNNAGNTFLHPVNHRCLSTEFDGNFDMAMDIIDGEVLQITRHTMDAHLRKRYRFLEHLPVGCEFAFVELDLTRMLSERTLALHRAELKERRSVRKKKEIALAKESKRVEREQSKSLREYFNTQGGLVSDVRPLNQSVDSHDLVSFPALRDEVMKNVESNPDGSDATDAVTAGRESPSAGWGAEVSSYSSVTSNMGLFPALGSSPQNANTVQGAWGSSAQSNSLNVEQNNGSGTFQAEESRKSRKSHGKTTILLSNAGSHYRR